MIIGKQVLKESSETPSKIGTKNRLLVFLKSNVVLISVFIVGLTAGGFVGATIAGEESLDSASSEAILPKEDASNDEIISFLNTVYGIDSEIEPSVATVTGDVEALKISNQLFYRDVRLGDKVILYNDRAILYRPSESIIINYSPLIPDEAGEQT